MEVVRSMKYEITKTDEEMWDKIFEWFIEAVPRIGLPKTDLILQVVQDIILPHDADIIFVEGRS